MSSEIRYIYIRACSKAKWKTCRFTLVKKTEGRDWCAEGGVSRIAKFSVTLPVLINCETSHQVSIVIFKTFLMEKKNLFVAPAVFIFLMSWHAGRKKAYRDPDHVYSSSSRLPLQLFRGKVCTQIKCKNKSFKRIFYSLQRNSWNALLTGRMDPCATWWAEFSM